LYVPVTKAASTSLKMLLSQVEETYVEPMLDFTPYSTAFAADYVHSPRVHGLLHYRDLSFSDKCTVLKSDDWWRIAVIRDPYERLVSTWQNRVIMLGAALPREIRVHLNFCFDRSGHLDVAKSFHRFVTTLAAERHVFFIDDHFRPQTRILRHPNIDFTHIARLEIPGHLEELVNAIRIRTNRDVELPRFNEGLGIHAEDVVTREVAEIIEQIYHDDFEALGYARRTFEPTVEPRNFSLEMSRLVTFLHDIVADRESRRGMRYGLRQIGMRLAS
jgi:hypothetical protein